MEDVRGGPTRDEPPGAADRGRDVSRALLDVVPNIAVQGYRPDGTVTYWNPASEKVFGYTAQEAVGRDLVELLVPPERRADVRDAIRRSVETGEAAAPAETVLLRRDGSPTHVHFSHAVVRQPGREAELFCFGFDVNDRVREEKRLDLVRAGLLSLGPDYGRNIERLTALCGELLGGACALYNRLDGERLCVRGSWQAPPDLQPEDSPAGHVCFDVIRQGGCAPRVIRDLHLSIYARTDPSVAAYGLRTYLGCPVCFGGVTRGSLCVVYRRDYEPTADDLRLLALLAAAVGQEEERHRAEEALRVKEAALDGSLNGIAIADLAGNLTYVNPAFLALWRYASAADLRGRPAVGFWSDPAEAASVIAALDREGRWVGEMEAVRADGTRFPAHLAAALVSGRDGRPVGYLASFADLTDRRLAEEHMRRSEESLRTILDTVDEAFLIVDPDLHILMANRGYCLQAGLSREEVLGRRCHEILHRSPHPCFEDGEECAVRLALSSGRPQSTAHSHTDPQGRVRFVETRAYPLRDAAGNVASVIESIADVTERHLLEEERLKTQKLESIGTLAGGIAHDFNNLLQGVFGYVSMAKRALDDPRRSHALLEQAEAALHLTVGLTSQLLTFSRGGRPVRTRLELAPVIESAARLALSGARAELRLDLAPDLRQVEADAGQIGQVIQNLVLNADQAMPQGGRVTVTARNLSAAEAGARPGLPPREHVEIRVRDEGIGIPAQHLEKVFDPYFTTKERGSGLGLATSYSIVRNHDGRLEVHSHPGEGSTFVIVLPAAAGAPAAPAPSAVPRATRTGRILVMDDDEQVRTVACGLLRELGHEAEAAAHGEAAVEAYRAARNGGRPFDAVILDLTVRGGHGGVETLRRLLRFDPGVKAVVSSGYSDDTALSAYQEHGFRGFLKKPYDIRELQEALNPLLA